MAIKEQKSKVSVKTITMIGLMAAVLCICAPFALPIGPIPISLATFVIYLSAVLLGGKKALLTCAIYLLIGLVGLPVFSGFTAGIGKVFGPTGGYLIGYLFMAWIGGSFVTKFPSKKYMHMLGMVLGTIIAYALGTSWLAYQGNMPFGAALLAGVIPFIPGDIIKILLAVFVGNIMKKRIQL